MNKSIILTVVGLVALSVIVLVARLLLAKQLAKASVDGKLNVSFAIKFLSVLGVSSVIMSQSIWLLAESLDHIAQSKPQKMMSEIMQYSSLYIGVGMLWFFMSYYCSSVLVVTVLGNRRELNEMEADHYSYFLIRGVIHLGLTLCLSSAFELFLRSFIPDSGLPIYH